MTQLSENANRYAMTAHRERRAEMSGELTRLERQVRHLKASMVHLDATLRLMDPDIDGRTTRHPGYAASQRIRKRIEEGFGWGKEFGLLRRIRMRGRERIAMAFAFSAAACNLIRLPGLLAEPTVA